MYSKPRYRGPYRSSAELFASFWPKRSSAIRSKKKRIRKKYSWFNETMQKIKEIRKENGE